MKDFKYKIAFSSSIKPLVSEEKDEYLALAALQNIGDFVPDIDTDRNIDLLPIAFNAFVANRVNKNGDVINTASALDIARHFINKPINIEHNRERIIGTILTAGYSEFGTDTPLKEENIKDCNTPFNVTLGGVIWRSVNSELANLIEDSSDPTSEDYLRVSASWELGFSDFNIVVLENDNKNIEGAEFLSDLDAISALSQHLRAFGGNGMTKDGKFVYRQVVGEIFPLGIGLTETPAADVKGILSKKNKEENLLASHTPNIDPSNNISQVEQLNVIEEYRPEDKVMKINSIKDVTDESIKEMSASAISDFIESELKNVSEQFTAEKCAIEDYLRESKEKHEILSKDYDQINENLKTIQSELATLKAEKLEFEKQETFNQRMSKMDEKFDLNDKDREVIASDIKDMTNEDFDAYFNKMDVLLSSKNREVIAKAQAEAQASDKTASDKKVEETHIEDTAEEVIDQVLGGEEKIKTEVPVSTTASEPTLFDKYRKAFTMDGFDIN